MSDAADPTDDNTEPDDASGGFLARSYAERNAEETQAHYDAWAATYDEELADNGYATPRRSVPAFQALVSDTGAEILDLGCGTGLFGRLLVDAGYTTIDGCDYSDGMLREAEATGLYRRLFSANLNEPPLAVGDAAYDAASIIGTFSFGHVEAAAMDEIVRVVKPGGAIVIGVNEKFVAEGSLVAKLDELEAASSVEVVIREQGDHLPGTGLGGWVFGLRRTG